VIAPVPGALTPNLTALVPLLKGRSSKDGRTTTYICEHFTCQQPVIGVEGLAATLGN
jgi:hypothetical protein